MRTITVNNSRVTLGSNAVPSALNEGPETTENFLAALADAIALAGRGGVRFVANGTHYSLNRRREVNREEYAAPLWSPKGTPVTWDDTDGSGAGTTTGLYSVMGPFASGLTYYQVIRNDGQHYWVTNPTRSQSHTEHRLQNGYPRTHADNCTECATAKDEQDEAEAAYGY